ncbi:hypothetical protein [Cobetia crustatorum]|uniref:hypothetical protein n=1 Tax=Cobetia crustatorum TaxID=553385 RepID=UPI000468A72B|nr:hypothetical protein [Cobetia crustatorum]
MTQKYNKIHEKLVINENDFEGMIAYSIYKKEKRDAIKKGFDVDEFTRLKLQANEIKKYKKEANELINIFLQTAIDEKIVSIRSQAFESFEKIAQAEMASKPIWKKFTRWHNNGAAGMFGNLWTAIIIALFVFIMSDPDDWKRTKDNAVDNTFSVVEKVVNELNGLIVEND